MKLGVLPLGRSTFDVSYAEEKLAAAMNRLDATGHCISGPRKLLLDECAMRDAIEALARERIERLLILQLTFTDAAMTVAAARALPQPLSIWAVPEPRTGERLRLNALCGLNLASHSLGCEGRAFSWLYADPDSEAASRVGDVLAGGQCARGLKATHVPAPNSAGNRVADAVRGRRIARVGEHPAGFSTWFLRPWRPQVHRRRRGGRARNRRPFRRGACGAGRGDGGASLGRGWLAGRPRPGGPGRTRPLACAQVRAGQAEVRRRVRRIRDTVLAGNVYGVRRRGVRSRGNDGRRRHSPAHARRMSSAR